MEFKDLFYSKRDTHITQKTNSESGRSMVEILGVLVLIGVLSIIGITGYQQAINRYRANETIEEVKQRALIHDQQINNGIPPNQNELSSQTRLGYTTSVLQLRGDQNYFEIHLANVPAGVCQIIMDSDWTLPSLITADDLLFCPKSGRVENLTFQFPVDLNPNTKPAYAYSCTTDSDCSSICGQCQNGYCQSICQNKEVCYAGNCRSVECSRDSDCPTDKPICQKRADRNRCVAGECSSNAHCKNPNKPYCYIGFAIENICVECIQDSDCPNGVCETRYGRCNTVTCSLVSKHTPESCAQCPDKEWNGHVCCPTDIRLARDTACYACGGIMVNGVCQKPDCTTVIGQKNVSAEICNRCSGFLDEENICKQVSCQKNSDCLSDEFCSVGNTGSCTYPDYQSCLPINTHGSQTDYIIYNGKKEKWIRSTDTMSWWDADNWCRAQNKTLASKDDIMNRNNALSSQLKWNYWFWTNSDYNACSVWIIGVGNIPYPDASTGGRNRKDRYALCH